MDKLRYSIVFETRSPLILANHPSGEASSVYQTADYITGASIRGAFIQAMKNAGQFSNEEAATKEINEHFLEDGFRFSNFYIANTSALPLSAVTCKQFPGFSKEDVDHHGVKDSLLLYYANQHHFNPDSLQCQHANKEGYVCSGTLTSFDKPVKPLRDREAKGKYYYNAAKNLQKNQAGHVAIDPITQTSQKGKLFFETSIDIGERFQGVIEVPVSRKEQFETVIKQEQLRVGSKRTSGFGLLEVYAMTELNESPAYGSNRYFEKSIEQRWTEFQALCQREGLIQKGEKAFTLTFMSDAILKDSWLRFRSDLTKELLERYTGFAFPSFELKHSHVATKKVSGWNQTWKAALDDAMTIKMGSSYLYSTDQGTDEEWIRLLSELEKTAVGEQTYEGFGDVYVCHPFHMQLEEV